MRINFQQLAGHLRNRLAPAYLICGDEPLQLSEAAAAVRSAARGSGFEERELLVCEPGFDWVYLAATSSAMSLFCNRKIIELQLHGARIGRDGSEAVQEYCRNPSADNLLLVLAPDLERKELKNSWARELDRIGVVVPVRGVQGPALVAWIRERLRGCGLHPQPGVAELLSERVEGNLVAAAQEVEKLRLLCPEGSLDLDKLISVSSDNARYDLFDLTEAALNGKRAKVWRILSALAAEGIAPSLVLWALARDLRTLASVSYAARRSGAATALRDHGVWESHRPRFISALKRLPTEHLRHLLARCANADRQIKGIEDGDPWHTLAAIADEVAGAGPLAYVD